MCLKTKVAAIVLLFSLCACTNNNAVFREVKPSESGVDFTNQLVYSDSLTVLDFEYMFNGAGVALSDINNDGLQDILLAGNMVPAKLYLNTGNLKFQDITNKSGLKTDGWCYGIAVVDINQDGYQDFYICKSGNKTTPASQRRNYFFLNNGNNTFTESAAKMALDDDGYDVQAAFFDYDKDGDLDMYLLRNAFVRYNRNNAREMKSTLETSATTDKLFRNDGNLQFTDVSREAGITIEGFGLGLAVCDINKDNWPDLYVSNDFLTNDLIWINNHDGTFSNKAHHYLRHQTYNAMGNDVADFNNDGNDDIVTVDMLPPDNKRWKLTMPGNRYDEFNNTVNLGYTPQYVRNTLQLNNGDGTFSEIAQVSGINATEWSWAPLFADFNNDGWKDLFVANGYKVDITNLDFIMYGKRALFMGTPAANRKERLKMLQSYPGIHVHNYIFKNNRDLTFSDVSKDWGISKQSYSNGAAYGDLDNDGDLDLVINNIDEPAAIYENQISKQSKSFNWIDIKFKGPPGNRDGLEAKIWLWQDRIMQYGYCAPVRGYLSSVPAGVHFGLQDQPIDSIKVLWPDGKTQRIIKPDSKLKLVIDYKNSTLAEAPDATVPQPLLSLVDSSLNINYLHKEDDYIDFKAQPILQHTCSHEGPGLAAGDVNGDGLDDFFIGAAAGSDGSVFLQQENGKFLQKPLSHDNHADDMGALFFDADKDGDLDLYVVSGGTMAERKGNPIYQDRLYLNDSKGEFALSENVLPAMNNSGASVIAADYDKDGDLDLFVCGRVSPGEYPVAPTSYLLRNDVSKNGAKFTDLSADQLPQQGNIGMVSDALWTDFDNDGWIDLVLAGEFMPITFVKNQKGKLAIDPPLTLTNSNGWWNSLVGGDFDNDGDIDFIAGNLGLNNWLKASVAEPVTVYAKDYDKNGRIDPILCHYKDGTEYMVHSRDDINLQMTAMKGRFTDYTSWAEVSFKNAFLKDEIADALILKCQTFSSAYVENKGGGKFDLQALPLEAQLSPINGMLSCDIDDDGNLDIICTGNSYSSEAQSGRNDAQGLLILKGNGKGNFTAHRQLINTASDNKAISSIRSVDGSRLLLVSSNSASLKSYRFNSKTKQIPLNDTDEYAIITSDNARTYKEEFHLGASHLSQSSRRLNIPTGTRSIKIYDNKGKMREAKL